MEYYIVFEGGKIYYSDTGQGETVILLHGYLESSEIWGNFARRLAMNFRVISVDLPGHGLSKVYGECHTMEFMASAIKGLIDCLQIRKIFLTGHSMGGYITMAFLELYPEMLEGYCLFHSHPFADSPETIRKRENEIRIVRSGKKYLLYPENISRMYATGNLEKLRDQIQRSKDIASTIRDEGIIAVLNGMMARPPRVSIMEQGKVPGLWILGGMDNIINADMVRRQVKLPANARVAILENSGHMGFVEEEDLSVKIVGSFFSGLKLS
ncbi:MAG: alpha/beta hydrolase [Bacteroidota bacterium]|nr:alpha/beta hydrolase [Bacteroidota bacterium]